jgi:hypothetical protein
MDFRDRVGNSLTIVPFIRRANARANWAKAAVRMRELSRRYSITALTRRVSSLIFLVVQLRCYARQEEKEDIIAECRGARLLSTTIKVAPAECVDRRGKIGSNTDPAMVIR